jgi:chloramphenicol 3-O phosphotransferase
MQRGTILIINGTSSSGKTSLVHALQDCLEETFLEAGIDKFIWMLPKRYLERPLWDEILGPAVEAGPSGYILVNGMHQAVLALSLSGCHVIADHVLVEPAWLRQCADLFSDLPAYLIGVRCPLEVLEERERSRKNRTLGQARLQFPVIHAHSLYDLEVDTSLHSPEECAAQIKAHLQSGAPPRALKQLKASLFSDYLIRPAHLDDCPALAHLQVDSFRTTYFDLVPQGALDHFTYAEQEQDWREFLQAELEDILLVAENDLGEIIGYALARPGLTDVPPFDSELVSLHVRRIHQGRGVGKALFWAIAQQMLSKGCSSLVLWVLEHNRSARGFYEHLGGILLESNRLNYALVTEVGYGWMGLEIP